jgi:hypothetical protein
MPFSECPAVFEVLRGWLATRLDVDPKEISLTGSARIGSSISPGKQGKRFTPTSDLDLFVVSEKLFGQLREEFNKWTYEFDGGLIQASNPREHAFWKDNAARGSGLFGYSGPNRPPVPAQIVHRFRGKPSTHSGVNRPPIPD